MKTNKKGLSEKQIITQIVPTENGYEATVIARDNFISKDQNSKVQINMSPDSKKDGILLKPDDDTIVFNKEKLQILLEKEEISQETFEQLTEMLNDYEKTLELAQTIHKAPSPDRDHLEQQLLQNLQKDPSSQINAIRELLEATNKITNEIPHLKLACEAIDKQKDYFGINKYLMDRFAYLPELLKSACLVIPRSGQHTFNIRAKIEVGSVGKIGLEHTLSLSNKAKTPQEAYINYINDMKGYALKVFLAYWLYAYEQGISPVEALLVAIMNTTKGSKRKGRFTPIERRRFWECTQLLESTYLTISIKIKKETITIRHQLLTILRKSSEEDDTEIERGYPTKVYYGILDPGKFKEAANLFTKISKETVKLDTADIMLALTYAIKQTQKWQNNSWDHSIETLIYRGGLDKTNKANSRQARKRLVEKTKRIQKVKGIEDFELNKKELLIKKISKNKK